jgi:hypothetical protein
MIFQTFQQATKARGARKLNIVNLGLEPWEAVAAGLEAEDVEGGDKYKPVADYVLDRDDGEQWERWLQLHRVELNAMTTPQLIAWLDDKMVAHGAGKLIPPRHVVARELETKLNAELRAAVMARILREAGLDRQVAAALRAIKRPSGAALVQGIAGLFERSPQREWRDHVDAIVRRLIKPATK